MNKLVTIFCEGAHDVVFIYKILKTLGYKSNNKKKIGSFPVPFNAMFKAAIEKTDIESLNLMDVRKGLLPSEILLKGDNHLFLYNLGGDGKKEERGKMLEKLKSFIPQEGEFPVLPAGTTLSVIYIFDADKIGITKRLAEVSEELNAVFEEENIHFKENGSWQTINKIRFGTYIFAALNSEEGKLEDILSPLMQAENEEIFNAANDFLTKNLDENRLFPLKISLKDGVISENRSTRTKGKFNFDHQKSLICVAGQLQKSGGSNTVVIRDTDFITLEKINANEKCLEIKDFLNEI
jgi:hypothetical protein